MKKILFTTDFSENAEKAFGFALNIAEKHQTELILAHVFDIPTVYNYPVEYNPSEMISGMHQETQRKLKEFFEQYDTNIKAAFLAIEHPSVVKGILSVIKEYKPHLVVCGTKGESTLKELLLGGTTKALVKRSPVPVLAVPEYAELKDYDKILYCSDLREVDLKALQDLVEVVRPYEPEIKIMHMSTDNEFERLEKMEWFKELIHDNVSYPAISFEVILADDTFETLNRYMTENDFDLLVMLEKERHGIIDKLFHQGLVNKMEFRTWIPLLSYNEQFLVVNDDKDLKKSNTIEQG